MDNFIISHGPKWGPKGQALASQQIGGKKIPNGIQKYGA